MKKKLFLVIIIALLSEFMAYSQQNEYFKINIEDNTVIITGYTGKEKNIQIPDTIDSIPVTAIGELAFSSKGLTNVIIPKGITAIKNVAFSDNRLSSIIIPESVLSIGHAAFENNLLQEIILPPHINNIGQLAFADNQLKRIVIPDQVKFIMDGAFADNQLTEIVIPNSVSEIGNGAFENNPLIKITIGSNVELYDYVYPFEESFCLFYIKHGKKAGTYIKDNGIWKFFE
ncbi:leucine-rich repeat domain-containing protein [Breznakiellaceae bacterium SP9]